MMPPVQRIYGNAKHFGKRPSDRTLRVRPEAKPSVASQEDTELSCKEKELREVVEGQGFERVTVLRDEIKALEGGSKA